FQPGGRNLPFGLAQIQINHAAANGGAFVNGGFQQMMSADPADLRLIFDGVEVSGFFLAEKFKIVIRHRFRQRKHRNGKSSMFERHIFTPNYDMANSYIHVYKSITSIKKNRPF